MCSFRSNHPNMKEIEHCYNDNKHDECPFLNSATYYDDKMQIRHKVNENNPSQLLGYQSIIFEVDMLDYQSKIMTYRASVRPNQVCFIYFIMLHVSATQKCVLPRVYHYILNSITQVLAAYFSTIFCSFFIPLICGNGDVCFGNAHDFKICGSN